MNAQLTLPATAALLAVALSAAPIAHANDLLWDANGGGLGGLGVVDGSGTWNTSNDNWYYGVLVINTSWNNATPDTATIGNANGAAGTITLGVPISAGNITFNAASSGAYTVAGAGANPLTLVNSTVTSNAPALISATLAGTTGLTKAGGGILTVTGANSYAGATAINGGAVFFNNASGSGAGTSNLTVSNAGSILGGSGRVSGSVNIGAQAVLSPGATTAGTAVFNTGALTLQPTAVLRLNINGSLTAGSNYDQVSVTGALSVAGSTLDITSGAGLQVGSKVFIALNDGVDGVTGLFAQGATVASGANTFAINYADNGDGGAVGNDISLTVTSVPEPSSFALGAAASLVGLAAFRRRAKRA